MVHGCFSEAPLKHQPPQRSSLEFAAPRKRSQYQFLNRERSVSHVFQAHREVGQYEASLYHERRTHLALDKDAPILRAAQPPAYGTIIQVPHVGGLHHHHERRAA